MLKVISPIQKAEVTTTSSKKVIALKEIFSSNDVLQYKEKVINELFPDGEPKYKIETLDKLIIANKDYSGYHKPKGVADKMKI